MHSKFSADFFGFCDVTAHVEAECKMSLTSD